MTDPVNPDQSAIVARRAQVHSEDRPERLSMLDLAGAVREVRETADLFRVWVPEWIVCYTSSAAGNAGRIEAEAFFGTKYFERVRDEDVRYESASVLYPDRYPYRLLLRLPNVKGEFKHRSQAEEFAARFGTEAQVVARNSRDEYRIKDYSTKKLARS